MNPLEDAVKERCCSCLLCWKEYNGDYVKCPDFDEFTTCTNSDEHIMNCEHFEPLIEAVKKPEIESEIFNAVNEYTNYPNEQFTELWNRIVAFLKKHARA